MNRGLQGQYVTVSTVGDKPVRAFVPLALPPCPAIQWTQELSDKFDQAHLSLGRLDSTSTSLPDAALFLGLHVYKEAVFSSVSKRTQPSLSDLLLFEQGQEPETSLDEVREVSNYVKALRRGLDMLKEGIPLSIRWFKDVHAVLMNQGRGGTRNPGEFRRSQARVGGTRASNADFIPPPHLNVPDCMRALELFLNDEPEPTPALLKAALAHVQFETIHPFFDGNGRLGRLLITMLLSGQGGMLQQPTLYLSLYFKTHRQHYYELLNSVHRTGDWEAWLAFFADAVTVTAGQAADTAQQLRMQSDEDRETIKAQKQAVPSSLEVHRALMELPVTTSGALVKKTGFTPPTVNKALERLTRLGIVRQFTARKRNRLFRYDRYMAIMERDAQLPEK